jgi:hypothetical protein
VAKEAYYFSHDSNARHDPKITAMRSVYGSEGYGWFWIIVELMREADGYKLDMQGRYTFNAYAMQMHTDCNAAERFITDCINEFNLFESDSVYFWSPSLQRRMDMREQTSEKRRDAANKRWGKERKDASASNSDANAMQGKERKGNKKESKKEPKKEYADYIFLTETEYGKLTEVLGDSERERYFLRFASWISGKTKREQDSRSAYLTILNWHRDSPAKNNVSPFKPSERKEKEVEPYFRQASGDGGN